MCVDGRPDVLREKNCNDGHYTQTVQPNLLIPVVFIGNVDFYHFVLLSLTLILPGGHKVSAKQNMLASFSPTFFFFFFYLIRMKFDLVIKQFKLNTLRLLFSELY